MPKIRLKETIQDELLGRIQGKNDARENLWTKKNLREITIICIIQLSCVSIVKGKVKKKSTQFLMKHNDTVDTLKLIMP